MARYTWPQPDRSASSGILDAGVLLQIYVDEFAKFAACGNNVRFIKRPRPHTIARISFRRTESGRRGQAQSLLLAMRRQRSSASVRIKHALGQVLPRFGKKSISSGDASGTPSVPSFFTKSQIGHHADIEVVRMCVVEPLPSPLGPKLGSSSFSAIASRSASHCTAISCP